MNDLEELKSLLFGAEKQTLDSLNERVRRPETRAADIADVLPEAVRLSHRGGDSLVAELRDPVGRCLKQAFHEEPQEYADALYPIMGPAIRKSIAHTLRAFAQQINQTMEHSLSARGLKWRMQAWRSGIPFSDFIMQRMLQYRVEQAYLISRENGLLMAHVHHDASRIKDSDAVSAMFTAIQDFVKESFSPDRSGRLETADMGEFTLWAVHGPHALMVCVIRGVPPSSLRADLSAVLERIHFRYGDSLRSYAGDTATVSGVEVELSDCLQFQAQRVDEAKDKRFSVPLLIAILLVVALLSYFAYGRWQHERLFDRLRDTLSATPGLYVSDITFADDAFTLHGLRDPLAASTEQIAVAAGLDATVVRSQLRSYQSLDSEIVIQRAIAVIDPPGGVAITVADGQLVVSGQAPQQWIDALRAKVDANTIGVSVSTESLVSIDWLRLETSVAALSDSRFFFSTDAVLFEEDAVRLRQTADSLKILADQALLLGAKINISVAGFTDRSGNAEFNAVLSARRAELAKDVMVAAGLDPARIAIDSALTADMAEDSESALRRVSVNVALARE